VGQGRCRPFREKRHRSSALQSRSLSPGHGAHLACAVAMSLMSARTVTVAAGEQWIAAGRIDSLPSFDAAPGIPLSRRAAGAPVRCVWRAR
jgi:hypothetical protein